MSLMTIPWTLSKRLWARARGEPSYFIVFSKNARCSSVRGCTYLTIGTSSWGVQSKAKVYIVLDMGRYYTKKLLGGRLSAEGHTMHHLYKAIEHPLTLLAVTLWVALAPISMACADVTRVVVKSSGPMGVFKGRQ